MAVFFFSCVNVLRSNISLACFMVDFFCPKRRTKGSISPSSNSTWKLYPKKIQKFSQLIIVAFKMNDLIFHRKLNEINTCNYDNFRSHLENDSIISRREQRHNSARKILSLHGTNLRKVKRFLPKSRWTQTWTCIWLTALLPLHQMLNEQSVSRCIWPPFASSLRPSSPTWKRK